MRRAWSARCVRRGRSGAEAAAAEGEAAEEEVEGEEGEDEGEEDFGPEGAGVLAAGVLALDAEDGVEVALMSGGDGAVLGDR